MSAERISSSSSEAEATPDIGEKSGRGTYLGHDAGSLTKIESSHSAIIRPQNPWKEALFIGVVCMAQAMTQAGLALSVVPAHIIGDSFDISHPGQLSWFSAAYSLTVGTFILVSGRLGDVYGHKLMFTIGFVWFGLWSLLGGFSVWSNVIFYDFCRAFQGVGPAILLPNALAILARAYPPGRRKEMVFCLFGATAPSGFIIGGAFCSIFAQMVWWPWGYWVMGIVCFLCAVLGVIVIPHTPRPKFNDDLPFWIRLDMPGAAFGVSGLILINFAWNQAGLVGWETPYTYALLIVGCLLLGGLAVVERRAQCPLLPRTALKGDLAWVLGCISTGWSSFGIIIYYFYQFMEVIKGDTPLLAVAKFSAAAPSGAIAAIVTGILLSRVPASFIMFCAMACFTVGLALMATVPVSQTYWAQAFVVSLVTCWGMDMSFPSGTVIISNSMPREHQGLAASLVNTAVNYSISLGLGFAGTVETHVNDDGRSILKGYRGALYMGVGLAGLGLAVSIGYMCVSWRRYRQPAGGDSREIRDDI